MICAVKRMPKKPTDKNEHVNQQPQRQMQPFLTHEISFSLATRDGIAGAALINDRLSGIYKIDYRQNNGHVV